MDKLAATLVGWFSAFGKKQPKWSPDQCHYLNVLLKQPEVLSIVLHIKSLHYLIILLFPPFPSMFINSVMESNCISGIAAFTQAKYLSTSPATAANQWHTTVWKPTVLSEHFTSTEPGLNNWLFTRCLFIITCEKRLFSLKVQMNWSQESCWRSDLVLLD